MNKLLNNLLGMYKQAKLNKKAESYKSKVAELLNDINEPDPIMDYISESEAEGICKEIGIPHEASWYKGDLLGYIDEVPDGMVDVLIEHISEEDAESLWRRIAYDMGMDVDAKKQTKMSKKAQDKESAKKDYTEQYAKVKEIMKEYGYGLSDGGYIYLISKEQPKDEGFQVKFKGDRLRVELDGKLKYSGYGPEAIEDFLKGMFYAKKLSSKKTRKSLHKKAISGFSADVMEINERKLDEIRNTAKDMGDEIWARINENIVKIIAYGYEDGKLKIVYREPYYGKEEIEEMYENADEAFDADFFTLELLPGDDTYADIGFVAKESSKNKKLTKKAGWKVLTPKDLTEEVNNDFLKQSLKDYLYIGSNEDDLYFIKGIKEKEGDQFSYDWEEGMFGEWRKNAKGEKWYSLSDYDNWDYIYLIKEDKLYKMPERESLTDFGVVSSKRVKLRKKAFRKLCLKRAFHKTAGEFEEMMKLKSTDPKLISYLAKEFGVEESTVSQYTDVSENAEELYNILDEQANKYGYEWDKFEYDEYGDRIDENDFRGDTDDLEKAVEYIKNNIDKSMFKLKEMGVYQDDYFVSSEYPNALIFSINEKLIPTENPVIYITNNTKNYDISFFVESQKAKEEDKAEGIYTEDNLSILIRRTSDEILKEIVNYVNVELPKKIAEQNKKQSFKTNKLNKKATKTLEEVAGLIDTILDDFDHYDYADQLEVGEHSLYENILADLQKDEKKVIEGTLNYIAEDDSDEPFTSKELVQLKEYYNNKFGKTATTKQAGNKVYIAKLYDKDGVKYDNIGKSENIDELKDLLRDWLFEKRKNRETNPKNNKFYLQDKIVIEDSNTGEPIETIKVSDLLSTYGRDYWKPFMETKATKKKAVLQVSENGMGYVLPNGQVVYPGDEAYLKSEYKANKQMLEKDKKELERLEGIIKKYPDINFDKNKDSVKFQIPRVKKGIEYLELFNETIEDILNAFKNKKIGKQATIKHENGVYNVYSESGKCLGKGYKTKEEAEKRLKQVEYFKHKKASRMDWEFPGYETEPVESKIEWLYTHNVNYNREQEDNIYKLRSFLKNKQELTKDDIEEILYELKHNNKNYRGDQYWIIDDLKVEDFIKNLKSNKRTSLKQVVISKMAKNLKDIPDSVKKNILSDLVYVILTGKGSFAYKTVAKKLETIIKELGYGDKLKANEDGSLPTMEIVELISKEPKAMELAGKFANITRAF